MSEIMLLLKSPAWWFTTIFVAILVNIFSQQLSKANFSKAFAKRWVHHLFVANVIAIAILGLVAPILTDAVWQFSWSGGSTLLQKITRASLYPSIAFVVILYTPAISMAAQLFLLVLINGTVAWLFYMTTHLGPITFEEFLSIYLVLPILVFPIASIFAFLVSGWRKSN